MWRFVCIVSVLFCVSAALPQARKGDTMTLDVYYESLCPDSRNFLLNQLSPRWPTLSTFTEMRLIPFGKAVYTKNPSGGWSFICQHGPDECSGNILHACGIKYSDNTTQSLTYASCLMKSPRDGATCAKTAGLDFARIDACHNSVEGQDLLHDHGVETLGLAPKLTFVPWLILDKVWEDTNQWSGLSNLKEVACKNVRSESPACLSSWRFVRTAFARTFAWLKWFQTVSSAVSLTAGTPLSASENDIDVDKAN